MNRISRDLALLSTALIMSRRSTCMRKQVGAVIALEGRVISTGYAGAPSGFEHCNPELCSLSLPCLRTVHAEANAIAFAARYGTPTNDATLYSTLSPCPDCAKLILNAGINRVVYYEQYRLTEGIDLLSSRIEVVRLDLGEEMDSHINHVIT